jgi:cytochrome c
MRNCATDVRVVSQLPDYAAGAHGNLADQNRLVGPVRGIGTAESAGARSGSKSVRSLAEASGCLACHGISAKVVGPGLHDIAAKYKADGGAEGRLADKVKSGGSGVWGSVPMPPNANMSDDDIRSLVKWILDGAG